MSGELFVADYAVGYKLLTLHMQEDRRARKLVSPYQSQMVWWPQEARARTPEAAYAGEEGLAEAGWVRSLCHVPLVVPWRQEPPHRHAVAEDCDCGIWAYHSVRDAAESESGVSYLLAGTPTSVYMTPVLALVRAMGEMEVYENAFRAEYARIEALLDRRLFDWVPLERMADDLGALLLPLGELVALSREIGASMKGVPLLRYPESEEG